MGRTPHRRRIRQRAVDTLRRRALRRVVSLPHRRRQAWWTARGGRRSGRADRWPSARPPRPHRLLRRSGAAESSSSVIVTSAAASLAGSPPCWPFMLRQASMVAVGAVGVVVDRQLGPDRRGSLDEQFGAEEARLDDRGSDAVRLEVEAERLHPSLDTELARRVGGDELLADQPGGRRDRDDVPGPLAAHHREHGAGDVHRAEQVRLDLGAHLRGADLFEVAGVEVAGVVDQHVDATEPLDRRIDGRLGRGGVGDVERHRQQVVVLAERGGDGVGVAGGGNHRVAGGERSLGDVDAHAAGGASDEPDLLVSHVHHRTAGDDCGEGDAVPGNDRTPHDPAGQS